MSNSAPQSDPKKDAAAQNAQEGLITVADLSLLTGVPVAQLTKLAKAGRIEHFGEYHGKRFFKFQAILAWALADGGDVEAKSLVRSSVETELAAPDCPYALVTVRNETGDVAGISLSWKVTATAAAA